MLPIEPAVRGEIRLRRALACSFAALVGGLLYLNALHNPFVYDDYQTVVDNPSIRHVFDLQSIVLYRVTRPIVNLSYAIDREGQDGAADANPDAVAFAAALLFASHPLMTEAVGYISGRAEVLCAAFFLLSVTFARRWMKDWMKDGSSRSWVLAAGFWAAAVATKEIGVMLPFVLLCYDRLMLGGSEVER